MLLLQLTHSLTHALLLLYHLGPLKICSAIDCLSHSHSSCEPIYLMSLTCPELVPGNCRATAVAVCSADVKIQRNAAVGSMVFQPPDPNITLRCAPRCGIMSSTCTSTSRLCSYNCLVLLYYFFVFIRQLRFSASTPLPPAPQRAFARRTR